MAEKTPSQRPSGPPRRIDPLRTTTTEAGVKWGLIGKFVSVLAVISVVVVVALYSYATVTTGSVVGAANDFLTDVQEGRFSQAYAATSDSFKANQDEATFVDEISRLPANDFSLPTWNSRLFKEKDVLNVKIDIGEKKPLLGTMVLTQSGGDWKISMFADDRRLYIGPGAWFETPPDDATVLALAMDSFALLSDALQAGEFGQLYETMAPTYTVRNPPEGLPNQFRPLLEAGVDLSEIKGVQPVLDTQPEISEIRTARGSGETSASISPSGGVLQRARFSTGGSAASRGSSGAFYLVFEGHFPGEAANIPFKLSYHYEHPEWQLHSIVVNYPGL